MADWMCWLSLGIIVVVLLWRVNFFRDIFKPKPLREDMNVIDPLYIGRVLFWVIIGLVIAMVIYIWISL